MQSNLYVHTKYENMEETYLYPIWEFFTKAPSFLNFEINLCII